MWGAIQKNTQDTIVNPIIVVRCYSISHMYSIDKKLYKEMSTAIEVYSKNDLMLQQLTIHKFVLFAWVFTHTDPNT